MSPLENGKSLKVVADVLLFAPLRHITALTLIFRVLSGGTLGRLRISARFGR